MAESKDKLNFRRGDDTMKCQLCANWGADGQCQVLGIKTAPQMVCDGFAPLEGGEEAALPTGEGAGQMAGEIPPELIAAIFGGAG